MKTPVLIVFESESTKYSIRCVEKSIEESGYEFEKTSLGRNTLSGNYAQDTALEVVAKIRKSESQKIILVGPLVVDSFGLLNGVKPLDVFEDGYRSYLILPSYFILPHGWWSRNEDSVIQSVKHFLKQ